MNRRNALQQVAVLLGSVISAPTMAGALGQKTHFGAIVPINAEQEAMLTELADTIIPTTNTPGAKAAGVEKFIVRVMRDCNPKEDQEKFYASLSQFNADCVKSFGKNFVELDPSQRKEAVKALTVSDKAFFLRMREMTVTGYFTSEIGAKQALEYLPIPGKFIGCVPLKPGQKPWAI
jgi:Gluconate 2-dehydrogenase subunit 3